MVHMASGSESKKENKMAKAKVVPRRASKGKQHAARAASFDRLRKDLRKKARDYRTSCYHTEANMLDDIADSFVTEVNYLRTILR